MIIRINKKNNKITSKLIYSNYNLFATGPGSANAESHQSTNAHQPYQVPVYTNGGMMRQNNFQPQPQQATTQSESVTMPTQQNPISNSQVNRPSLYPQIDRSVAQQPIINPAPVAENTGSAISISSKVPRLEILETEVSPPSYLDATVNNDRINFDLYKKSPSFDPTA